MRRDGQQLRGWGKEEEYTSWGSISEYVVTPPPFIFIRWRHVCRPAVNQAVGSLMTKSKGNQVL